MEDDYLKIIHPSFAQYLGFFAIPLAFFYFLFLGVDVFYVFLGIWIFEMGLFLMAWAYLSTTFYILKPDCLEIRSGILVKRSRIIPFDQIVNITSDQTFIQRLFGIGNVYIDTAGGKPLEIGLFGIEKHEDLAELLFALKKSDPV